MMRADDKGNVLVEVSGKTYSIANDDEYIDFLIWLTTPDPGVKIRQADFDVESSGLSETDERLNRYSEFLKVFVSRRDEILSEQAAKESMEKRVALTSKISQTFE